MTIRMCVLLWAREGQVAALQRYEEAVLALIPEHHGRVISRDLVRQQSESEPAEVQIIEFADQSAMDGYLGDPRRLELHDERDAAIASTQILSLA